MPPFLEALRFLTLAPLQFVAGIGFAVQVPESPLVQPPAAEV